MSGLLQERAAHTVVRCSGVYEDGSCGREQAIESHDGGVGVRVATEVPDDVAEWLSSFGWRSTGARWLCPFCAVQGGPS
ncbi:MAG TPA: hypothetical protein VLE97_06140 [Gaiellaceae bacterium]|nr:hypothetical protein [Gaiellaceae bacterium]